jgi:hypothetical protein
MDLTHSRPAPSDVIYAAAYAGAIVGSAIALFFLVIDLARGAPLATPSLLGSAIMTGGIPSSSAAVRIDLVAMVSVLHLIAFGAVGGLFALLLGRIPDLVHRPVVLGAGIFATLTAGIVTIDLLLLDGIVSALNPVAVVAGNAVAAACMAVFYRYAFETVAAPIRPD